MSSIDAMLLARPSTVNNGIGGRSGGKYKVVVPATMAPLSPFTTTNSKQATIKHSTAMQAAPVSSFTCVRL